MQRFISQRKRKNLIQGNRRVNSPYSVNNDDQLVSLKIKYGNPFKPQIKKTNRQK